MPFSNDESTFWAKVDQSDKDGCWPWLGGTNGRGYGKTSWSNQTTAAHRLAYYLIHGYWPKVCRHSCDNTICCNPDHLKSGSNKRNTQDMIDKGRGWWQDSSQSTPA